MRDNRSRPRGTTLVIVGALAVALAGCGAKDPAVAQALEPYKQMVVQKLSDPATQQAFEARLEKRTQQFIQNSPQSQANGEQAAPTAGAVPAEPSL